MTTTTSLKPRQSAIPTPGKPGSRSTPSRSRASSSAGRFAAPTLDVDFVSRAFADAVSSNDPAHHRANHVDEGANGTLSPGAAPPSGRQSVTGRPSSVASSTSTAGSLVQRPRTPTSLRTTGRPSDITGRSISRNGRIFDIGDQVRIESLGFEGTLRFLGDIDGKPGIWAGVELSGGFSGKGKNDGSVNGKRYFVCPPYCGVFVSTVKLSMPTVGRAPIHRPPSAASSRSGRHTPSVSGRPSYSAVPIGGSSIAPATFPVGGRMTPSRTLGGIACATTPTHNRMGANSRVLKSATNLSKQAQSLIPGSPNAPGRNLNPDSMVGYVPELDRSRILEMRELKSHSETPAGLPEGTPKYRRTPHAIRARIPSAVAMPPPLITTPAMQNSASANTESPTVRPVRERSRVSPTSATSPCPSISASFNDVHTVPGAKSERRPGSRSDHGEGSDEYVQSPTATRVNGTGDPFHGGGNLENDQNRILMARISDLQGQIQRSEAIIAERDSTAESLRQALLLFEKRRAEDEQRVIELEHQISESTSSCNSLRETLKLKDEREAESESILMGKDVKIIALETQVNTLFAQLDSEKKELSLQVEELRRAGQETIALYEERLNEAECKRFELEDRIVLLEARPLNHSEPVSSGVMTHNDSVAQIDNESLRDHVRHLQRNMAVLEDKLEEVQATSENEGMVLREKLKRSKEKEETMRRELIQGRKETEQALKSEASARLRLQEVEEALRENTTALEDARAEVEGLRAELANVGDNAKGHPTSDMRKLPSRSQVRRKPSVSTVQSSNSAHPHDAIQVFDVRNGEPEALAEDPRRITTELRETLTDRSGEQNTVRLVDNANISQRPSRMSSNTSQSSVLRNDEAVVRDEITGLKFIVHELQDENSVATQKIKVLEAANELLRSESEQLRQDLKILEDGFEKSILREEQAMSGPSRAPSPADDVNLQVSIAERLKTKYESELDQLRKKLADADAKNARLVLESNKEINELETLVESKIYREDELEAELERTKATLARLQRQLSDNVSVPSHSETSFRHISTTSQDIVCEICEKPGHDIFTCSLLKEGPTSVPKNLTGHPSLPRDGAAEIGAVNSDERVQFLGQKGVTIWFTGLSASGKSTIACALEQHLIHLHKFTYRLDGDNVRFGLNSDLGFDEPSRNENIRRIGEVSKLFADACCIVLTAFISPYRADRARARDLHTQAGLSFIEVFVDAPLDVVEGRDPKDLYKKARAGKIKDFTGISAPYEAPENPEVHIKTNECSVEEGVHLVMEYLTRNGLVVNQDNHI